MRCAPLCLLALVAYAPAAEAQWDMPAPEPPSEGAPPEPTTPPEPSCPPAPGQPPPPGGCGENAPPPPAPSPLPAPPSAGGLTAPAPIDATQQKQPTQTEKELEEAKEEDSERGLSWFYVDVEGGFQHVGLETFEVDEADLTAGFVDSTASGGFVGAGLGARIFILTIGPRFRVGFFENWQMFSIGGELGLRFQLGIVEPHFNLGAGYTALGNFSAGLDQLSEQINIRGVDARITGGLDVFVTKIFAIGFVASWEFLALTRPGVDLASLGAAEQQSLEEQQRQVLAAEGSGYGSAINIGARLGLHF